MKLEIKCLLLLIITSVLFGTLVGRPVDPIIDPVIFIALGSMVYVGYSILKSISGILR